MARQSSPNDEAKRRLSPDAFDDCFNQFSGGVRAFLGSKLANEADVEDCSSRVFEKLWIHGDSVNPAARGAWLFVVARREAALHWRKQKRSEAIVEELARGTSETSEGESPADSLLSAETAERLRQATETLPHDQRVILRKRFFEDLSFREIAEELNLPLGTALTRVHAALKRLRKILAEDNDDQTKRR